MLGHLHTSHYAVLLSSSSAILANFGLIILIAKHSRPEFGNYKYLMMLFATFNIIYPLFHLILLPGLHVVSYAFSFYIASPLGGFISQSVGQWMILYWCILYNKQLVLIVFHFLYRYIAVCEPYLIPIFKKWSIRSLLALYVVVDLTIWSWFFETQSWSLRENRWYLKEDFWKFYGMNSETASVLGPLFKYNDTNGVERFRPYNLLCTTMNMSILVYKFILMIWFTGKIHNALKYSQMSIRTKRMQLELLKALIAQTACPFVMEGVPCFLTHFCAFNAIYIGPWCSYVLVPVSLYPLMDAITMTYFIRDYRRVVLAKWRCQSTTKTTQISSKTYEKSAETAVKTIESSNSNVF